MPKTTPMMKQYFKIKEENPDCLLLFRLGDFYEMFGEDAIVGSTLMEITLTSRERSKGERIPMCGIPYHALESYLPKLLSADHKVAICDQVEDPRLARGIVRREVTRIVTPGTVLENTVLDSGRSNYLVSIASSSSSFGLSFVEMSSGEFLVTEFPREPDLQILLSELSRRTPKELLISEELKDGTLHQAIKDLSVPITFLPSFAFLPDRADSLLRRALKIASLESVGLEDKPSATVASAAALFYLEKTQKRSLDFLGRPRYYSIGDSMLLDTSTVRNLELIENIRTRDKNGTLLEVLDRTRTPMGRRLIRKWILQPLLGVGKITRRLDAVDELAQQFEMRTQLIELLEKVRDTERLVTRIAYGNANARDLLSLARSLDEVPEIRVNIAPAKSELLQDIVARLNDFKELRELIGTAIRDDAPATTREGGMIKPGFDAELDRLNDSIAESRKWISSLEAKERQRLGIRPLKVGFNRVFGYYIEVSKANLHLVPPEYMRKQTLVGGERFVTPELEEKERFVLSAEEKIQAMELEIFNRICSKVTIEAEAIRRVSEALSELDVLLSFATVATLYGYTRPVVKDNSIIRIEEGRHPMVERTMPGQYVPNDALLDNERRRFVILTGPNMAGKSTFMRQTALIVLMAQMGSFVPAKSAEIGIVDRVFTRVGAFDDLIRGQSTFMVEMIEVANILNSATSKSFILLDEMGRGTSTFDGLAIAWAIAERVSDSNKLGAKTIFATHYHQLTDLANYLDGVVNQCMTVREVGGDIIFLREVADGRSDRSYGVHVAQLAGLPEEVLRRAEDVLAKIEQDNVLEVRSRFSKMTQMTLFGDAEQEELRNRLKSIDLSKLSPEEAHKKLAELLKLARGEGNRKD